MSASPQPSHPHTLMCPLPVCRLREILSQVLPSDSLSSVINVASSTRLSALYTLNLASLRKLTLVVAPSPIMRLLRHERVMLTSEAALVNFLRNAFRLEPRAAPTQRASNDVGENIPDNLLGSSTVILRLLPSLLRHSSNTNEMGQPYTIYSLIRGESLSSLSVYLSLPEKRRLDNELGILVHQLSHLTSPNGNFGTLDKVCGDSSQSSANSDRSQQGHRTWLEAFKSLFEAILRDGEDMAVLLPYEEIRAHLDRLSWRLGAVRTPRLVVLDVADWGNVLVESDPEDPANPTAPNVMRITGLRDWSQGTFGDPIFCSVFENPSQSFLSGWESGEDGSSVVLIDDVDGKDSRLLLYMCYRAVVAIVTHYYRPHMDSSKQEMEGRRKLMTVLADLQRTDNTA